MDILNFDCDTGRSEAFYRSLHITYIFILKEARSVKIPFYEVRTQLVNNDILDCVQT